MPAKKVTSTKATARKATAKKASVKKASVRKAAVERASVRKAPVKKAPAATTRRKASRAQPASTLPPAAVTTEQRRPARPARPVGLARQLEAMDDAALVRLLQARPDALQPPRARSFERLANALGAPHSILRALDQVDQWLLHVAVALMYLGGAPTPDDLRSVLPPDVPPEVLEHALDRIEDLALVQRTDDGRVHPVSGMAQVVAMPKGFGPPLRNLLAVLQPGQLRFMYERVVHDLGIEEALAPGASKQVLADALRAILSDPDHVVALVRAGPPGTEQLATRIAHQGPSVPLTAPPSMIPGAPHRPADDPVVWCVERGVVIPASWALGMMPREVTTAIRGEGPLAGVAWRPPPVRTTEARSADDHADVAGHRAASLLEHVGRIVSELEHAPLATLKTGGIGARTLKPLAKDLGLDERDAAFLVDLAAAAGLVAMAWIADPALDELSPAERRRRLRYTALSEIAVLTHTDVFQQWRHLSPAARWVHLADAWVSSSRWVELAGRRDDEDKLIPALDVTPRVGDPRAARRAVLAALRQLPDGASLADDTFAARLEWEHPLAWTRAPGTAREAVSWIGACTETLGLTVTGTLSPLGSAYATARGIGAAGDVGAPSAQKGARVRADAAGATDPRAGTRALLATVADVLPDLTSRVTLQADLTAVAAGPLAPEVITGLASMAEVESRGAASVFRFTEASLRSALDAGRTADDILGWLEEHADREVPQPLRYLVTDTERRHGTTRVGTAMSYVRSDDPAVVAQIMGTRKLAKLQLHLLAPTVAVCDQPPAKVLTALRACGFLPVEEDATGAVVGRRVAAEPVLLTRFGRTAGRAARPGALDADDVDGAAGGDDQEDVVTAASRAEGALDRGDAGAHAEADEGADEVADEVAVLTALGEHVRPSLPNAVPGPPDEVVASLRAAAAERAARAAGDGEQPPPSGAVDRSGGRGWAPPTWDPYDDDAVAEARLRRQVPAARVVDDAAVAEAVEWLERQHARSSKGREDGHHG